MVKVNLKKLYLAQILLALLLFLIALILFSPKAAESVVLSAVTVIVPNIVFGFFCFRYQGASAAHKILTSFYAGEAIKLLLTVVLLVLFTKYCVLNINWFLSTFMILIMTHWFAPWLIAPVKRGVA